MLAALIVAGCASSAPTIAVATPTGRAVYERECLACHMADGRGVPGMTPGLIGSPWLAGPVDALIGFVLTGGYGPDVLMARFDYLGDAEMAVLLTYVRAEFGSGGNGVSAADVARMREQLD
jgi:mono/diheme cytochrome c family protein